MERLVASVIFSNGAMQGVLFENNHIKFLSIFLLFKFQTTADGRMVNVDLVIAAILHMAMMSCGSCHLEKIAEVFVVLAVKERATLSVQQVEAR
jgi:hypothetical protein